MKGTSKISGVLKGAIRKGLGVGKSRNAGVGGEEEVEEVQVPVKGAGVAFKELGVIQGMTKARKLEQVHTFLSLFRWHAYN